MVLSVAEDGIGRRHPLGQDHLRRRDREPRALVDGRRVGERRHRDVGFDLAVVGDDHAAGVGRRADDGEVEPPLLEDGLSLGFRARLQHHQHALLAFRQHHLVCRHARFALRHVIEVEGDADAALVGHLAGGRGEAGGAHVLNGDDDVLRHQFEARLDEQLFGERVADLHGGALLVRFVVELGRGHGGAVDAVAAGLGADVDDGQPDALRRRVEDLVGARQPGAHRIDQDVVVVALVEVGLAADGRHADAIAVAADAGDDAVDEVARLGVIGRAKAQGVEVGDGAGAHGEHVAHDAADAGRRALVGLDVARVVVALHLEHDAVTVAEVDDSGVLAGALDDLAAAGRQRAQPDARGFVRAVLAPHDREDAELGEARLTAEDFQKPLEFALRQPVLGDDFRRNFETAIGFGIHARALGSQVSSLGVLMLALIAAEVRLVAPLGRGVSARCARCNGGGDGRCISAGFREPIGVCARRSSRMLVDNSLATPRG